MFSWSKIKGQEEEEEKKESIIVGGKDSRS